MGVKERFTQASGLFLMYSKKGELISLVAIEDRRGGLKLVIFLLSDGTLLLLFDTFHVLFKYLLNYLRT